LSDEELDFLSYTRLSATGDFAYALESFRELESRGYSPTNFQLKSYLLRKAGRIRESEEAWAAFKREIPEASLLEKKVDLA
jgi:hypothetical protein